MSLLQNLIGQEAVITIRNRTATQHGPFASTVPDTIDIKGTVLARPHWEKDVDVVAVAVPFTEVPLRMIHLRNIVAVNGVKMIQPNPKRPDQKFKINSSNGSTFYEVTETKGTWRCTCVANKSFGKLCKHIKQAKGEI